MAEVLVSSVIRKLAALLGEEYKKQKSMQREVAFLKDELGSMNAVLNKLTNMEELDPQTKEWRNQVMDMAFDIEDCIDDFMHHVGGDNADLRFVRKIARRLKTLRVRRQIANRMQELKARVKDVSERRQRYNLDECASSSSYIAVDPRMPTLYMDAAHLVALEGPKGEIKELLTEEEGAPVLFLRVVSIVGFGGLGKTTLANEVYRELGGQYDYKAFVTVSQRPDLMKLLCRIISAFKPELLQLPAHTYEVQYLVDILREYLQDKRYFLVIDDIWDESVWEILCCAFPANKEGSKVIITTRIETVAKACCSYRHEFMYKMKPLDYLNSRELFFRRIGQVCDQPFKDICIEILQKCGGLPLAIISIASLLASQPTRSIGQWKYVCSSLSSNLRTNPTLEGMRQVLKLSYNNLHAHLKTCLLYIGIYPEDYSIEKQNLVRKWVAEGCVSAIHKRDAEEVAGSYFNELVNRSMIQPTKIDTNGEVLQCKVHDMILDLITFKAEEENFYSVIYNQQGMTTKLQGKVRRLSLHLDDANQDTVPSSMSLSYVRSISSFPTSHFVLPICKFKYLRVLCLEPRGLGKNDMIDLTPMCKLFQLRYLKISINADVKMPTQIGRLQFLETLEIDGCITGLPSDIIRLPRLLHLCVPSTRRFPDGIDNMKSLRTLRSFNLALNSVDNLKGLGELTNLRDLRICVCDDAAISKQRDMELLFSSIGKLVNFNLRSLQCQLFCHQCQSFGHIRPSCRHAPILADDLSSQTICPSNLERLEAIAWLLPRFPKWTGQLHQLYLLHIGVRKLSKDDINVLSALPALADLWLWTKEGPKERIIIRCAAFPAIKCMRFTCFELCLSFEVGAMPNLRTLHLGFHAQGVELYGHTLEGIEHLPSLSEVYGYIFCGAAKESYRKGAETVLRNAISMHPRQPRINIYNGDDPLFALAEVFDDGSDNKADTT